MGPYKSLPTQLKGEVHHYTLSGFEYEKAHCCIIIYPRTLEELILFLSTRGVKY